MTAVMVDSLWCHVRCRATGMYYSTPTGILGKTRREDAQLCAGASAAAVEVVNEGKVL